MNTSEKEKRERGRGRIYQRPGVSAFWWMAFYSRGKQYRMSTGETDEKKALTALKRKLVERDGEHGGGKKMITPQQQRITVKELLEGLKVDYKLRGKSGARLLSNLKPLEEHFGEYRAMELISLQIDKFIDYALQHGRRKEAGKPAKPASINRSLQLLGQAYKLAIANGCLTSAPRIRRLSERDNVRTGFFSDNEFRKVAANLPTHLQDFALFGYLTGWRKGEIKSLLWDEVEGDVIRLRAENSKNGESRIVTFETGELSELMARRQAARVARVGERDADSRFIFHNGHKDKKGNVIGHGEPIGDFRKAWATACKLAGVEHRLFHDLRRTAVREMLRSGVHESTARKISGHKTASMLQRYNIQSESDIREAMQLRETRIATQQQENRLAVPLVTKVIQ
jgi:integrase